MTTNSNFECDLNAAITAYKTIRDDRMEQVTSQLQDAHLSTSWDDLQTLLQQAFRDAGLEAYAQMRRGEALPWSH